MQEDSRSRWPAIIKRHVRTATPFVQVDAYLGSYDEKRESQDAWRVVEHADRIVFGVADGVTPTSRTPSVHAYGRRVDGARYAAYMALDEVRVDTTGHGLRRCLERANRRLLDEFGWIDIARDRPQAAAVLVSVPTLVWPIRGCAYAQAADCDLWIRRDAGWWLATRKSHLDSDYSKQLKALRTKCLVPHAADGLDKRIAAEERIVRERAAWNVTALGRFEVPKLDCRTISTPVRELAIVTDGAKLWRFKGQLPIDPTEWLIGLREFERSIPSPELPHSDVAMIHVRLSERPSASSGGGGEILTNSPLTDERSWM